MQPGLENFVGQGIHKFSRQPFFVSVPHHSVGKEFLQISYLNLSSFDNVSLYPIIICLCKMLLSLFFYKLPSSTERPQ